MLRVKMNLLVVVPISVTGALATVLLAGCAGSSSTDAAAPSVAATTVPPVTPTGFTVAVDQQNGYQVAVPSEYKRIQSRADLDQAMKAGKAVLSDKGLTQQLDNKTLKTLTVNPKTGNAINVVVNDAAGATAEQLPQLRGALEQQAKKLGGTNVRTQISTLGGEPAIRTDYVLNLKGKSLTLLQYIAVHDKSVYTLTFTEPVKIPAATEAKTVASWRFL